MTKIYYHPVSTTSRPIMLFAADHGLDLDFQVVDLFKGEHLQGAYAEINPSRQVPVLEEEGFRLTEVSAILKYLAERNGSPAYPTEVRARARVNERLDWLNTGFYRDFGYGLLYPQVFPHLRRADDAVQAGTVAWGRDRTRAWLEVLDRHLLGPQNRYLCGSAITLADYFGFTIVTAGEVIHLDYSAYPNVVRWIETLKARPKWAQVNEPFYAHFVAPFKSGSFVGL